MPWRRGKTTGGVRHAPECDAVCVLLIGRLDRQACMPYDGVAVAGALRMVAAGAGVTCIMNNRAEGGHVCTLDYGMHLMLPILRSSRHIASRHIVHVHVG